MNPEQTISFRVYKNGQKLLGVATVDMPELEFLTETLSGSGIAGEYDSPTLGMTGSMSSKLSWVSQTPQFYALMNSGDPMFELYASVQQRDRTTSKRKPVGLHIVLTGDVKKSSLGTLETGKKHGNETEIEVLRLEADIDGEQVLLIDKLNMIFSVNGEDALEAVRAQLGE